MNFDLRSLPAEFYENPYPTYQALNQQGPIVALPDGGYFVTDYGLAREIYRDAARFSSDKHVQFQPVFGSDSALFDHHTTSLVFNDPPLHTRVRRAIGNALSSRVVQKMRPDIEQLVDNLLNRMQAGQTVDLIDAYASSIPVEVIGNLLGVPADERAPLRDWSLAILGSLEVTLTPEQKSAGDRAVMEFRAYLRDLIARRESRDSDDVIGRLLTWQEEGQGLSESELHHQCIFLLNAGHETTTNLIGNAIELLLRHPQQLARLHEDPTLVDPMVEEALRFESPNQLGNRTTTQEVELGGLTIPAQQVLTLCIGAANRDSRIFNDADRFDIGRNPNPHLAFGAGVHTCAGLNLARLEGAIAIQTFVQRFPTAQIISAERSHRARFRGFAHLRVAL